jgi:hypothetical protein
LRRETTLSIKEIALRVYLGTSKGANANLHRHMRRSVSPKLPTSATGRRTSGKKTK